jgi:hypothetical protein
VFAGCFVGCFCAISHLMPSSVGPPALFWTVVTPLLLLALIGAVYELIRSNRPDLLPPRYQTYVEKAN